MSASLPALLKSAQLIPVIEFSHIDQVMPALDILLEHQFNVIEVTLRHTCALDALTLALKNYPQLTIGVGSITSLAQLKSLVALNPAFVVSPGLLFNIFNEIKQCSLPYLPGVMTPSEIMQGIDIGLHHFKFFPTEVAGGIQMLKSLAGPFKDVYFCPTGGVRLNNLRSYLDLPNVFCVGASWFIAGQDLVEQNWSRIRVLTREARSVLL